MNALYSRVCSGDREAFSELYLALHDPLWRMAIILVRSRDIAEEIVQDLFLAIWVRRESLPHDVDIRAYLYKAVRNRSMKRARHMKVVSETESRVENSTISPPALGSVGSMPDISAESNDFYLSYHRALGLLTDRERIAVRLRWENEMTFEQIGDVLGVSKVGARHIVLKAEAKVKELLYPYRPDAMDANF